MEEFEYGGIGRGGRAVSGLAVGAGLAWLAVWLSAGSATAQRFGELAGLMGAVALLAGAVQGVLYVVERWLAALARRTEIESASPRSRILEAAGRLNEWQASLVPAMDLHEAQVDVLDQKDELLFYLWTGEGRIPFSWLRDFLKDCGVTWLRPVRSYSEGTPGYEYARAFTSWCVGRGYAFPAEGPHPAQWATEQVKSRLMRRFGFEPVEGWELAVDSEPQPGPSTARVRSAQGDPHPGLPPNAITNLGEGA